MKLLEAIRDIEISATGGFAIYVFLCIAFVTITGLYHISALIFNSLK